ncbi:AraC family transcriptional regulator [Pseudorhodobacter sp.]|uniref:AraC family transcriptional regulator n=1 Tax=Pseudorhodobacter sp. TaxID=1934400 RepID=UPI00264A30AA|nr:AraC family transcriptional regulator [Pseudorhodobacter sp.]MDN5786895.1 AraC family transcriptional regulator [Pseudorhodobacter sp.]
MQDLTKLSQLRVIAIPRLAAGGRWRVEAMRALSEPVMLWFTKGQGRITIAGSTRGYTANNAVFIPPGVMYGFEAGPQVFGTAVFFGRNCDVTLPKAPHHLRVRETFVQQELNVTLDAIVREMDANTPAHDRATRHYLGLLGVWLERQVEKSADEVKRPDAAHRLVARYSNLLERNFRSGMGVSDFAGALGVTPTHLTRCCKQACGKPASALLQDRLIFEARTLLAETKIPVGEIADVLGFTSPAYFTRAFHLKTGRSPSAFRKEA